MKKYILIILVILNIFSGAEIILAADVKKPAPFLPFKTTKVQPQSTETQPSTVPVVPVTEVKYSYNPLGKSDPFRPFVEEEAAIKRKTEKKDLRSIFPLQREEINKFRIVGIAGEQNRRIAIVEDMTKKYYPLFIGTNIGTHRGKVVEILPDRVVVEEYETKKAKRIILKLHKDQNEVKQ